jgi:hypothetical protein
MKHSVFIGILLLFCAIMHGQVSASQLLASAWDDPTVQLHREQQAYLEGHRFKLPLLRQIQLQTESRDWDPVQQEYTLRFNTNSPGMMQTQADIAVAMRSLSQIERQALVQKALEARYDLLIDAHFAKLEQALMLEQQKTLQDRQAVLKEQLVLGLEDGLNDFFRAEEDALSIERKLFGNQADFKEFEQQVAVFIGNADSLAMDSFPSISQLLAIAGASVSTVPPSVAKEQVQSELATLKAEMQERENRNYFNFLQFKYSGNAKDELPNRFLIGAGFRFPWMSTSKLRQQEKELQALEAKADAAEESLRNSRSALAKLRELARLVQLYNFTQDQKSSFVEQYDPKRLHATGLDNPETLLRVKLSINRLDAELFSIMKDVYKAYLNLLSETGFLTAEPARNYLSPGLDLIPR